MNTQRFVEQIDAYLKPTQPGQYAVVISRRFLLALKTHLELMQMLATTQTQPTNEQKQPENVQS
jgi:hypothetical protein